MNPVRWFIDMTRRPVQRVASAYGLRVDQALHGHGQHKLIVEGDRDVALGNIPRSVYFNTRSGCIRVGANTVFGEGVMVLTGKHASIAEAEQGGVSLHHVSETGRDVMIGSGCYVGSGAIIIGPVTIGNYAVIGAGSVVTKDVAGRCFVAGVPAVVVRQL